MPHRSHDQPRRRPRLLPATLRVQLGRALALLATIVCTLILRPEQPGVPTFVRLASAERWVSTPIPTGDQDECTLVDDVVDVDDDEANLSSDDATPCDLGSVIDFRVVLSSRPHRALPGELPVEKTRLALGTHPARGPPAARPTV